MFQEPRAGWNKTIEISIHTSIHTSYGLQRPAQQELTSQKGNIPRTTRRLEQNDRDFHSYFHPYFVRSASVHQIGLCTRSTCQCAPDRPVHQIDLRICTRSI